MATPAAVLSIIVEANTGKAEAALKEFQRNLSKADREKAEAELAFQVEKGGYNVFSGLVKKADAMSAEASLGFDVDQASLAKAKTAQAVLTKESSRLSDVFDRSQLSIGQWTTILAASLPVIFDLAGALGALTASLGAATAGIGALTTGAGAAGIVGIAGIASVAAPAIASLGDLKTAQDAYTEAVERYGKGSSQAATALTKLTFEQERAGPLVTSLSENLSKLTSRWKELTRAGQGDFIGMLDDGITRLNKKLPMLAKSANTSMAALRKGFDQFLDRATGPEFDKFIDVMTRTFAKSIGPVARAFGNIAKVLQRIAVAVAPDIVKMARDFEGMTEGWLDSTRNAGKLRETVHGLVGQTKAWWRLLVAAKDLIVAVLVPGMGQGKKAVQDMTGQLKEWTNWANAHPDEIRDFMKQGLKTTKQLAQTLVGLVPVLLQLSKAMRPITTLFLKALQALSALKFGNISALTLVLGAIVASKIINGVKGLVSSFTALRTALFGAAAAETALGAATVRTTTAMKAQQVMAQSSMFGGGLARKTTAGGGIAGGTAGAAQAGTKAGGVFSKAAGAAVRTAWPLAVGYGIFKSFTTSGGIIDTLKGKGSASGAEMGESMASGFIEEFQPKVNRAIRNLDFKGLDRISGKTQKMIDVFDEAGIEIPDNLRKFGRATENQSERAKKSMERWQSSVGQLKHVIFRSMDDIKDKTKDALRDINRIQGISNERREDMVVRTYRAEIRTIEKSMKLGLIAHRKGHREIEKIQRQILRAYGVKDVQRLIVSDKALLGARNPTQGQGRQRGGHIPGAGEGDKVPAMLEPGEFVVNKKATQQHRGLIEKINKSPARFQAGGPVDRTGVQHFAKGGMAAMMAEANKFEQRGFPYVWGGGHGGFGIQPVDCSGAVSQVLHAAGLLKAPMVSGDLAHWGKAGKGPLTVYANPTHTFMSLAGKFFGTSSSNPGGGAGWFSRPDRGYLSGFAARTMDVKGGMMGPKVKLPRYKATALAATGTAASLNTIAAVGEMALREAVKAGGRFGGGQGLADFSKGPGKVVGASVYGFGEPGTGTVGASGVSLPGKPAFAELDMGTALGHLPFGKKVGIEVGGKRAVGVKLDIGAGGGAVGGHHRAIDFWRDLAEKLGLSGSFLGLAKVRGLQKGGMVAAPYVGAFQQGGEVAKTGLGLLHEGERVLPKRDTGGTRARADRDRDRDRSPRGLGVEQVKRLSKNVREQIGKVIPRMDERIDIASQLAGLSSSPGGSELTKPEVDKQMALQRKLLAALTKTLNVAERGLKLIQRRIRRIEDEIKRLERKIRSEQRQMDRQVKRVERNIKQERKSDKPDNKQIERWQNRLGDIRKRHARPMDRWQERLGRLVKADRHLGAMRPGFREAVTEMSGLTGGGGRIFDTKLAIKELRASAQPQGVNIGQLLEFAEAMRYGAFNRQLGTVGDLPSFAKGGVVPGRQGEPVPVIAHGGEQFLGVGQSAQPPVINVEARVFVGDREITDIVRTEIKVSDRKKASRYRAGVVR